MIQFGSLVQYKVTFDLSQSAHGRRENLSILLAYVDNVYQGHLLTLQASNFFGSTPPQKEMPRRGVRKVTHGPPRPKESSKQLSKAKPLRKRLIVSVTAKHKLELVLRPLLLAQTLKPDLIIVHGTQSVPVWIRNLACIAIHRDCNSLDAASALAGLAGIRLHPEDIIVCIDDERPYHNTMLENHVRAHHVYPGHVFCSHGSVFDPTRRNSCTFRAPPMLAVHQPSGTMSLVAKSVDLALLVQALKDSPLKGNAFLGDFFSKHELPCRLLRPTVHKKRGACEYEKLGPLDRLRHGMVSFRGPLKRQKGTLAIVLFAFNRPGYLKRVLRSLEQQTTLENMDIYVFVDGIINFFSGRQRTRPQAVRESLYAVDDAALPVQVFEAAGNYGVGLMQFYALDKVFCELNYEAAIVLEDDLVLGRDYLASLLAMLPALRSSSTLSSVQAGYRHDAEHDDHLNLQDARKDHVHYWGWMTTRDKFRQIYDMYSSAVVTLFGNVDYSMRNTKRDPLGAWFKKQGLSPEHRSQDWVRDACFRKAGMTHKLVCARRRAAPIGERGLHCNPKLFRTLGLDRSTDDIDTPGPVDVANYILRIPVTLLGSLPDGILRHVHSCGSEVFVTSDATLVPLGSPAVIVCSHPDEVKNRKSGNTRLLILGDARSDRFQSWNIPESGELPLSIASEVFAFDAVFMAKPVPPKRPTRKNRVAPAAAKRLGSRRVR